MKKLLSVLLAFTMVFSLTACGGGQSASGNAGTEPATSGASDTINSPLRAQEDEVYYMLAFYSGIEYWKGCYNGFTKAAELYGAKTEFGGPTDSDIASYVNYIRSVIAKNPAGIALTCNDSTGLIDVINEARAAGIPVVTYDSDSAQSDRLAYLGTGNYNAGAAAAKFIAEQIGHAGEVAIVGSPSGSESQIDRIDGFVEYMEKNEPDIQVVAIEDGKADSVESSKAAASIMQAYPGVKGFYTTSAQMGAGVATAVEESGNTGEIKICAFDTDNATLDFIKAGVITGSVAQGVELMGYWSFQFLFQTQHDLVVDEWEENRLTPLPTTVDTGVSIVTKENADLFYAES
ncbi:substrate-binding domain-containing protein [Anaerofilum sp. BX8]|uniref:Substrate-binding domain-containing protein n=1 Tax=Anaerofilum hominis TaxID=2763016 RepID=A0A923L0Q9_9FIRM|nr:substrate-binding domain-containing protein [Anaerofilum hominis]MBC5580925.1 substrate-binding domain-containing protein [Anaerofilum hominis]